MVKWIITGVLLLPVAEVATFVVVALLIGFGWAFTLMVGTSIAGFVVLRRAGRGRIARLRAAVTEKDANGANTGNFLVIVGGILLFLPGFLTDLAGALLLIGPVRRRCATLFRQAVMGSSSGGPGSVVDLNPAEWQQVPDREPPRDRLGNG